MASAIIHLCVAKKVNEYLNLDEKEFYLGNIAPDISKQIGLNRNLSHFKDDTSEVPNLDLFLDKYKNTLDNPFNLGYYCHLFTDLIWFGIFMPEFRDLDNEALTYCNGDIKKVNKELITKILYNDYTNLNVKMIDEYNLDLSLFYEESPIIHSNITEIPLDKLPILIDKMGIIVEQSHSRPTIVFDTNSICRFIDKTALDFIDNLKEIRVIS